VPVCCGDGPLRQQRLRRLLIAHPYEAPTPPPTHIFRPHEQQLLLQALALVEPR
jgi:hypothetical protein